MGYSEIYCQLCGVGFNIARIRTTEEPRSHAWNYHGRDGPGRFVYEEKTDPYDFCPTGCFSEHREDSYVYTQPGRHEAQETFAESVRKVVVGDEEYSEDTDQDYKPEILTDDEMIDVDVQEEWMSASDGYASDREASLEDLSESEEALTVDNDEIYQQFIAHLNIPIVGLQPPVKDATRIKAHSKIDEHEIPEHLRADWNAKQNTEELEEFMEEYTRKNPHHLGHPLSLQVKKDYLKGIIWEHIAGPNCRRAQGYSGNNIEMDEMQHITTTQDLVNKNYQSSGDNKQVDHPFYSESEDDPWELTGDWFLSGLADSVPGREQNFHKAVPTRHGITELNPENVRWDGHTEKCWTLPFHPTCLEIWKRLSIRRFGKVHIGVLGDWWVATASEYKYFFSTVPWHRTVKFCQEQYWNHENGTEWLTANPVYIKNLKCLFDSCKRNRDKEDTIPPHQGHMTHRSNAFVAIPAEIKANIYAHLTAADVARLMQAIPSLQTDMNSILHELLIRDRPYLWELWPDSLAAVAPRYSFWSATTAAEIKKTQEELERLRMFRQEAVSVLIDEGFEDIATSAMEWWEVEDLDKLKNLRNDKSELAVLRCKPELEVPRYTPSKIDFSKLVLTIEEWVAAGKLKGLENRERIWESCDWISTEVGRLRDEGILELD